MAGTFAVPCVSPGVGATIEVAAVPVIDGVRALVEADVYPGGSERNLASVRPFITSDGIDETAVRILADAQTSGGLLISVPAERSGALIDALIDAGTSRAVVIGAIAEGSPLIELR